MQVFVVSADADKLQNSDQIRDWDLRLHRLEPLSTTSPEEEDEQEDLVRLRRPERQEQHRESVLWNQRRSVAQRTPQFGIRAVARYEWQTNQDGGRNSGMKTTHIRFAAPPPGDHTCGQNAHPARGADTLGEFQKRVRGALRAAARVDLAGTDEPGRANSGAYRGRRHRVLLGPARNKSRAGEEDQPQPWLFVEEDVGDGEATDGSRRLHLLCSLHNGRQRASHDELASSGAERLVPGPWERQINWSADDKDAFLYTFGRVLQAAPGRSTSASSSSSGASTKDPAAEGFLLDGKKNTMQEQAPVSDVEERRVELLSEWFVDRIVNAILYRAWQAPGPLARAVVQSGYASTRTGRIADFAAQLAQSAGSREERARQFDKIVLEPGLTAAVTRLAASAPSLKSLQPFLLKQFSSDGRIRQKLQEVITRIYSGDLVANPHFLAKEIGERIADAERETRTEI
ncbi:unnamed protein product, partial [Amoebophrya sp. A120]|eukprot:GSA120T00025142001.1